MSTEALANRPEPAPAQFERHVEDISPVATSGELATALAGLEEFRLIEHDDFDVYCAPYERLGIVMEMIAVAREITFRAVGEGTGLTRDSDQFDPHYCTCFSGTRKTTGSPAPTGSDSWTKSFASTA